MAKIRLPKRSKNEPFLAIPKALIESTKLNGLSGVAVKLLIQIAVQYTGSNNGDLQASFCVFKYKGWKSSDTFNRALKELVDNGYLVRTRQGRFPNVCSLFALTWKDIDESVKYDSVSFIGKRIGGWK